MESDRNKLGQFKKGIATHNKAKVIKGDTYGKLIIINEVEPSVTPSGNKYRRFMCKCECGNEKSILLGHLRSGKIKSCGCLNGEQHGLGNTKLYGVWRGIINRCYLKSSNRWLNYGGRGIFMCDKWRNSFLSFYNWSVKNGYKEGLQIDRKNNDGNYDPNNCRYVTPVVNSKNKSNNTVLIYHGEKVKLVDLVDNATLSVAKGTTVRRLQQGWSAEDAIDKPLNSKRND